MNTELWRAKFEEITVKSMKCVDIKLLSNGEYAIPLIIGKLSKKVGKNVKNTLRKLRNE